MRLRSRRAAAIPAFLALALIASPPARAQESALPRALAAEAGSGERPSAAIAAPERARQGDLVVAWAACAEPRDGAAAILRDAAGVEVASAPLFDANALALAGAAWPRLYGFLLALPTRLPPGPYSIEACGAAARLTVEQRGFASETIKLDAKNTAIRTKPDKKKEEEAKRLYELLARADPDALYVDESAFLRPLAQEARRSALFGDRRVYAYSGGGVDSSEHGGYDFAVVEGTPVFACARGRVAMAADRIATGKTLVVEHLPGLYSVYMHLSAIEAEEGSIVERGQRIALSGSTGLSTGPHLHWELRANGAAVDPEPLLAASPLDKALIINTIRALIEGR